MVAPPPGTVTTAAPGLPATFDAGAIAAMGLDPDYARELVYTAIGADGPFLHPLEAWDKRRPLHVCAGAGVDAALVAALAGQVGEATGIAVTPGPCNVTFVLTPGIGHTQADRTFEGRTIVAARILLVPRANEVESAGLHELGHVLGLGHSARRYDDVMSATDYYGNRPRAFTSRELAVLGRLYRQ